ncbi:hypothetical protein DFQ00_102593 [Paenibacillus barcinonensis]|uniref:Uncharacterized protein n=1 Tax=Paenibacillus barcinonensis TaxID=198119 RepID=A0A2V4VWF8_PAEBA|nr:hypothetical protein DFQ00_102593 [Paenibacillus barcinonensis]
MNPFTGEPVTDDYAKMMISSLKWSQIVAGIGMVTGSMKSGKGPYKGRGTSAALDKVKQTIRDAKAKREQAGKSGKGPGNGSKVNISKEVEIVNKRGESLGELDEIDLVNMIFYEDKSAQGLHKVNPKTGLPAQTPQQFADKQILIKTRNRINALENATSTRATKNGSSEIPNLEDIKDIREFVFRLDGNTPDLKQAVENSLSRLRQEFPDYKFSAIFGGK